jgi:uncharacterized protein DUF3300
MRIPGFESGLSRPQLGDKMLVSFLSLGLLFGGCSETRTVAQNPAADQDLQSTPQAPAQPAQAAYTQQTPEELQRLVAPIALYPDSLVAQILAASTFPEEVVEADRWLQAHPDLKDDALAQAVDKQPWDPSVKALTAFPSVLGNMDKNLSWASSLGDAYYNQQDAVMDAIQVMRQKAQEKGTLKTTDQQVVTTQGSTIVVEPASPQIVYVPAYDPWLVYGYPIDPWPFWYPYPGIWFDGPFLSFGFGFGIGFFGGFGWGWGHWGCDWRGHYATFDHGRYYSHSRTFYNRNSYYRGGGERGVANNVNRGSNERGRGGAGARGGGEGRGSAGGRASGENRGGAGARGGGENRAGGSARPFGGNTSAARGYGGSRGESGTRSGAFGGYGRGGETRGFSGRGSSSFGGGGFRGGGGGGFHGGGGGRR